jgi:GPI-anchor transamidase subunit K
VRRLGVPDYRIVLMLADEHAVGAKNPYGGAQFGGDQDRSAGGNLHPPDAVVDYAGPDVTPETVYSLLSGRHGAGTPAARMLAAGGGPSDRLFLYMTGHGGDGFLKFHDKTEMAAEDLADALAAGRAAGRFGPVLALFDTCQAATLTEPLLTRWAADGNASSAIYSGGSRGALVALASSVRDENSYATGHDTGACVWAAGGGMWAA